ncbi:hypothetical protein WMY93_001898 [Mugilogobius chulae]|uniref:Nucleobindin-1 n=1 Tax=Mugilogobius chulae TaxID=88201 RepID=A0AAW0Q1Y7_9GOBI
MSEDLSVSLWCEETEDAQSLVLEEKQVRASLRSWSRPRSGPRPSARVRAGPRSAPRSRPPGIPPSWDTKPCPGSCSWSSGTLPSVLYVRLIQGRRESRDQLVKWAMEVCSDCGCEEQVFPLSVSLLDRFLSSSLSVPAYPFCLIAACVLVASKLSECETLPVDTLCAAAEYSFSSHSLREMERVVVATLRWDLASVTPQDFLPHFLSVAVTSSCLDDSDLASTVRRHSDTLAALCVSDSRFLGAPPSLLAAGSLCCALKGLRTNQALDLTTERIAHLCQTDPAVLQCYSEMIEFVLQPRRSGSGSSVNRRMWCKRVCVLLLSLSVVVLSVPLERNEAPPEEKEEPQEENMDTGLYYDRYLREVIEVLETDSHFREKLQTANTEDIKSGRLSKELDLVGHHVRTRLDELKRQEVSRLRMLLRAKLDSANTQSLQMDHASLLKQFEHLDPHNQNTFEAKDLELLISTATKDLENYDAERHEEFKRYEMLKEHERREYLKSLDQEKREQEQKRLEELKDKHRHIPKSTPRVDQLKEVWEETDGLDPKEFNPKTFFKLHDTNEDGVLDEQELEALFTKELEKVYNPKNEEDDMMEMEEERLRMREHVMNSVDLNKDRLVSLDEFIKSTEKKEFNSHKEWETLDTKQVYTEEELQRFEAELRDKEEELKRRAAALNQRTGSAEGAGEGLEAQRREYQQAVLEMSHRQKEQQQQPEEAAPPAGPNGELHFQPQAQKQDKVENGTDILEPPQNLPLHP